MPNLLYVDTSSHQSLIMLFNDEKILAFRSNDVQTNHAQLIHRHIEEVMAEAGIRWLQLSAVCVLNGPGSYTGLRISLAAAKGICYAQELPLVLVNKLDLMAASFTEDIEGNKGMLMKAREGEYFSGFYDSAGHHLLQPQLLTLEMVKQVAQEHSVMLFSEIGTNMDDFDQISELEITKQQIQTLCLKYYFEARLADLVGSEPFYLKNPHINKINKL